MLFALDGPTSSVVVFVGVGSDSMGIGKWPMGVKRNLGPGI